MPEFPAGSYEKNGFFTVAGLFTPAECEVYKTEAMKVLKEKAKPGSTVFVGCAGASPLFHKLASDPRLVALLKPLLPGGIMFMSDKFVFKSGEKRFATPWHSDAQYWKGERPKLSVWIALDEARKDNGALKVLQGSHLKAWKSKAADTSATNGEFDNTVEPDQWKPEDELVCEVRKGGAIVFDDRLMHASCTNDSGQDRYSLISTYHAPAPDTEFDKYFPARHVIS